MTCAINEVKVLYNGSIDFTRCVRLELPFPNNLNYNGYVDFEWTLAYACGICPATPDEYTFAGCQMYFRPNIKKYRFAHDSWPRPRLAIEDSEEAAILESNGWKKSRYPITKNLKREQTLRREGKWDTIIKNNITMRANNIISPVLDIHALARADWATSGPGRITYAAVVSVRVDSPFIRLYERIREQMPHLVPIRLRAQARRRV